MIGNGLKLRSEVDPETEFELSVEAVIGTWLREEL